MHGLRRSLLHAQFEAIGLPYSTVELPKNPTMEEYEQKMSYLINGLKNDGFTRCAFGDIFLEDLKKYREENLKEFGIHAIFPLWKRDTRKLLNEFLGLGFRTIVVCCNAELMDKSFVGREIDQSFIDDLPKNVDPCGENGEFHTFCFDGPIFKHPVEFEIGEKILRDCKRPNTTDDESKQMGFWFCDLMTK